MPLREHNCSVDSTSPLVLDNPVFQGTVGLRLGDAPERCRRDLRLEEVLDVRARGEEEAEPLVDVLLDEVVPRVLPVDVQQEAWVVPELGSVEHLRRSGG